VNPILRRYLEACLATPFGFYEITACEPAVGFHARNLLTGAQLKVSESLASISFSNGDIAFALIVTMGGFSLMDATSPYIFPPTLLTHFTRRRHDPAFRDPQDAPLRRLYFDLLEESYLSQADPDLH
jgi:hypothetical protein